MYCSCAVVSRDPTSPRQTVLLLLALVPCGQKTPRLGDRTRGGHLHCIRTWWPDKTEGKVTTVRIDEQKDSQRAAQRRESHSRFHTEHNAVAPASDSIPRGAGWSMEPAEGERVFPPFSMPLFGSPSVLPARPPPSVCPPASFQIARFKREDARTATALPLTRSLGRTFAWAPQAAGTAIALSSAPAAAI